MKSRWACEKGNMMEKTKEIYLSAENIRLGHTPENDYDPRYYDLSWWDEEGCYRDDTPDPEVMEYIESNFDDYRIECYSAIYTEDYRLMEFLQEETFYGTPVWFDVVSPDKHVYDELEEEGWTW